MNHSARPSRTTPHQQRATRSRAVLARDIRERILDATLALLREGGIRQVSQVRVARRAGVRQSHLTYYFPTRHDLLEATTMRFVESLAQGLGRALGDRAWTAYAPMLARLAGAVTEIEHMRMFIGVIVEADKDPTVRAIIVRGTQRLETALALALGGGQATARASLVLAALWGLGLYGFALRPPRGSPLTHAYLGWLEGAVRNR